MPTHQRPPINFDVGIALGSGSAKGMAHIGVLRELEKAGLRPGVVAGTSAGALMGAAYACNQLDFMEDVLSSLNTTDIIRYLDINLSLNGGFADANKLIGLFQQEVGDILIEDLPIRFGLITTDLNTGREVWLKRGPLWPAVRASIAIPGLLTPVCINNHWLVDGGLVNPVPVSLGRALGAESVLAVNLLGDVMDQRRHNAPCNVLLEEPVKQETNLLEALTNDLKSRANSMVQQWLGSDDAQDAPGLLSVVTSALDIMQVRITRSRLAGDPPEILFEPRVGDIGLLEFNRSEEAINEGRSAVKKLLPILRNNFDLPRPDDDTTQIAALDAEPSK